MSPAVTRLKETGQMIVLAYATARALQGLYELGCEYTEAISEKIDSWKDKQED